MSDNGFYLNSFTATGIIIGFANSTDPDEPSHLDLRCLTFIFTTLHIILFEAIVYLTKMKTINVV